MMAAMAGTQDSHGPRHVKRDATPEECRIHCEPYSEGGPVGSPDLMNEQTRNRGHRKSGGSGLEMWVSQVEFLSVSSLRAFLKAAGCFRKNASFSDVMVTSAGLEIFDIIACYLSSYGASR